ncbi:hypothetical protein EDB89DRAFT_955175 [Lactarius sanguifluus]|nr:hypothetical protein EDB89DRAFT_955175 [Lactarius sanguifluus]
MSLKSAGTTCQSCSISATTEAHRFSICEYIGTTDFSCLLVDIVAPELFACVLDCIPSIYLQRTVVFLRIFSYGLAPNWRRYLFYRIRFEECTMSGLRVFGCQGATYEGSRVTNTSSRSSLRGCENCYRRRLKLQCLSLCISMNSRKITCNSHDFNKDHLRHLVPMPEP